MTGTGRIGHADNARDTPTSELIPEAARLLRAFNLRILDPDAVPYPSDAYTHLGTLLDIYRRLPQALDQLRTAARHHHRTMDLYTNDYTPRTPNEVSTELARTLELIQETTERATDQLRRAHVLAGYLGIRPEDHGNDITEEDS